jgi:mannose-1-phosphate guanylyltransferase
MLHTLIMAGGGGTRFWPRSRQNRPKQFLQLTGDGTLLQQALVRIESLVDAAKTWVITADRYRTEVAQQVPRLIAGQIIGEPVGRDTAACIAVGAALIARQDSQGIMLVMPADHVIEPAQEFRRAVQAGERLIEEHPQALVTFGIRPTFPATGYGYVHCGQKIGQRQGVEAYRALGFREKPAIELAERMLSTGEYFWNSGIFMWRADTILDAMKANCPALHAAAERIGRSWGTAQWLEVLGREYQALERISIDYAVMEKAKEVLMVEAPFRWDDVGSWLALERLYPQDVDGNTILAQHCGLNTKNCLIAADSDKFIATIGVDNLLIVQDGDAILIADRRDEGAVKQLVELMRKKSLEKYL